MKALSRDTMQCSEQAPGFLVVRVTFSESLACDDYHTYTWKTAKFFLLLSDESED
jgi:hypothetical protein